MANLITDIYLNGITKGIDEKHNLLKNIFSEFSNIDCDNLNKLLHIKNDILFANNYNDILVKITNNKQVLKAINKYGYEYINKNEYPFSEYNFASGEKLYNSIFEKINFVDEIKIKDKVFSYFIEQGYLILYNESDNTKYFFNLENINIKDLKIDKYNFIYILYVYRGKQYLTKTHFAKVFSKYNENKSGFNIKETFYTILLEDDKDKFYSELINIDANKIYLLKDKIYYKELYNKYYFIDGDYIYFNHHGEMNNYKKYFIEEIQVEFNNIYNYLNFLGLNNFKIKNRKLSTYEIDCFKDLFINKFDSTINGSTNYFLVKNHYDNPTLFKLKPDYHINYKDNVFVINGNFNYKMQKGVFKIIVQYNKVSLYKSNNNKLHFLESIIIDKTLDEFYFYQLKFQLINLELPEYYEFNLNINDNYIFKQQISENNYNELVVDKNNINYFLSKENTVKLSSRNFKNNSFRFWNLFDWKKKRFIYNSIKKELKANDYFDLINIKEYRIFGSYDLKNNKIFARNDCIIYYTLVNNYIFELINNKGYITEFWKQNQDKDLYLVNSNNQLIFTDEINKADFKIHIPKIKDYININKNIKNIDILMNDELEYELLNNENILATTKFKDEPLFWKVYIENDVYSIYDEDGLYINNFFEEDYNSGKIVYFNKEYNKKYYYILEDGSKNYFEPIKAFENIKIYHNIDKLGISNLNKNIYLLSINTNKIVDNNFTCKIYVYDSNNNIKTITLKKNDLNKTFEVNVYISKVKIDINNPEDFYIIESSNDNIIYDNKIIYFKKDYDDICYLTYDIPIVNYDNIINKININKKYLYINNQLIEDNNGNIYLEELQGNCLFVEELNKEIEFKNKILKTYSASNHDKYYEDNFKSVGIKHEYLDLIDSQKIETYIEEIEV